MPGLFIGLMSGTSLDGVDGVVAEFSPHFRVLAHASGPFSASLRSELWALNTPGDNELHRAALAANALARTYAALVQALLQRLQLQPADIAALGAHGQTVRHQPGLHDGTGYTLQLNNPAMLAELTGIDVVADFRSRDVAAGGQGAPLVPAFHQQVFGRADTCIAVLNLGGIANLSVLRPGQAAQGFDCGPGNALLDHWCQQHTGQAYDDQGQWAASGQVQIDLLACLLSEAFFQTPPPKSTGRDLFNPNWLQTQLRGFETVRPQDIQATLSALTASSSATALQQQAPDCRELIVCGGGAFNLHVMRQLQEALPSCQVVSSAERGLPPLEVEASAFAWLARQRLQRQTGNLPSATGARGARVLGAVYPA
jgi:anhydro-N-acetylmuramic acid kinase